MLSKSRKSKENVPPDLTSSPTPAPSNFSKDDIRNQLSDIEKRLFHNKPSSSADKSLSKRKSTSSSSSRGGLRGSIHSLFHSSSNQLVSDASSNEVKFTVELSESLLAQCRMLTAENTKYKSKLKSSLDECLALKEELTSVKATRTVQLESDSDLKEKTWELESNIISLNEQLSTLERYKERSETMSDGLSLKLASLQISHDEIDAKNKSLMESISSLKLSYSTEIDGLNEKIEELNDENDAMALEISQLKMHIMESSEHHDTAVPQILVSDAGDNTEDTGNFTDILDDAELAPVPQVDASNNKLEIEMLRSNLIHANQTNARLRSTILKLRKAGAQDVTIEPNPRTPRRTKVSRPGTETKPRTLISPYKKQSKYTVTTAPHLNLHDFSNVEIGDDQSWHDFLGDDVILNTSNNSDLGDSDQESIITQSPSAHHQVPDLSSSDSDSDVELPAGNLQSILEKANGELSREEVEVYVKNHNLKILTGSEYSALVENDVCAISNDKFVRVGKAKGFLVLSTAEYDDLIDEKEMRLRLAVKGFVTLPTATHKNLEACEIALNSPTFETLKSMAEKLACLVLQKSELDELQSKAVSYESPSPEYVREKCVPLNLHLLNDSEFEEYTLTRRQFLAPDKAFAASIANKIGLMTVSPTYYDSLVASASKAESTDVEHLTEKARSLNLVVIPQLEHETLVSTVNTPSIPHLKEKVERGGYTMVAKEEWSQIRQRADSPDASRVKELALVHNLECIDADELQKLQKPHLDLVKSRAEELNHVVCSKSFLEKLTEKAETPGIAHVRSKAAALGFTVVDKEEFEESQKHLAFPPLEYLTQKAEESNFVLVEKDAHSKLVANSQSPTLEFIREKASGFACEVIEINDLRELRKLAHSPNAEQVKDAAQKIGYTAVPESTYDEFYQNATAPSLDHLRKVALNQGYELVTAQELASYKKSGDNLSLDDLARLAAPMHASIIDTDKLTTIQDQVANPTLEFLQTHAKTHSHVVELESHVVELKAIAERPSFDFLSEKAFLQQLAVLPVSEYEGLKKCVTSPSKEFLKSFAASAGLVIYENQEASELEFLSDRAATHESSVISNSELAKLRQSSDAAQALDVSRSTDCAAPVQKERELNVEELMLLAVAQGHVLLEELRAKELQDYHQQDLSVLAAKAGKVLVSQDEHEQLLASASNPSLETITKVAKEKELVLVPHALHENLQAEAALPLEEKAAKEMMCIVKREDFELCKEYRESPLEFLESTAVSMGKILVGSSELERLRELSSDPDVKHIKAMATKRDHVVLPSSEFEALKEKAGITLEDKARADSMVLMTEADHAKLLEEATETLDARAKKMLSRVLKDEEFEALFQNAEYPSVDRLDEKAKLLGHVVLEQSVYDELTSLVKQTLDEKAELEGKIVVDATQYDDMRKQISTPTLSHLQEKAKNLGFAVLPDIEYQQYLDSSNKLLQERASEQGMVLMSQAEYDEKLFPALQYLNDEAIKQGHVLLKLEDFKRLEELDKKKQRRDIGTYGENVTHEEFVFTDGAAVVDTELQSAQDDEIPASLKEQAAKLNLRLIPINLYNSLMLHAEKPSMATLVEMAELSGFRISPKANSDQKNASQRRILSQGIPEQALSEESGDRSAMGNARFLLSDSVLRPRASSTTASDKVLARPGSTSMYSSRSMESSESGTQARIEMSARLLGLSVLPQRELLQMKQAIAEKDSKILAYEKTLSDLLPVEFIHENAAKHELVVVQREEYMALDELRREASTRAKETASHTDGKASASGEAAESGVKLLDLISNSAFKELASKRGYIHKSEAASMRLDNHLSNCDMTTLSTTDTYMLGSLRPSRGVVQSDSIHSNLTAISKAESSPKSVASAARFSIGTNVSLTDGSMIPAITQVVIGEYLFKYFRRLGAFSAISETRHERYFWVHPYTLTLYWSEDNPSLSNPESVKTRAAAIISVESVEDNNPLPTGLYHKSIIIHSQSRSIKFTCPTRQRHNVWFNAMRYLIDRNINQVNFEGDTTMNDQMSDIVSLAALKRIPHYDTGDRHAFPRARASVTLSAHLRKAPSMSRMQPRPGPF